MGAYVKGRAAVAWTTWAVEWLLPRQLVDEVVGDVVEEFELRCRSAPGSASVLWVLSQFGRSLAPMIWMSVLREGWLTTIGAGLACFIVVNVIEAAADLLILPPLAPNAELQAAIGLLLGLAAMTVGGYLAARIRAAAPIVLSMVIFITVAVLMRMGVGSVPLWYELGFLILGPLAALKGGTLFSNSTA
jgi:hypothetical protein